VTGKYSHDMNWWYLLCCRIFHHNGQIWCVMQLL